MINYVIPHKNEQEFIDVAEKLGYDELCFLYPAKDYKESKFETKLKIRFGIICSVRECSGAKHKSRFVVVRATPHDNIRMIIEKLRPNCIIGAEDVLGGDFLHHRSSGLNHILTCLMAKFRISYGVCFSDVLKKARKTDQAVLLGRIKQNITLCRKSKVNVVVGSFCKNVFEMRCPTDTKIVLSNIDN